MKPLAERMRPRNLDEFIGQEKLMGKDGHLRKVVESGKIPSMIFWGPPGVGKTTLAQIIAEHSGRPFYALSAINSGVKDIRDTIEKAEKQRFFDRPSPILFIDEIHRFSKSQQDALLGAVEKGVVTLIGATTENPSFEVNSALISRSQVYVLSPLSKEDLLTMVTRAIEKDSELKNLEINIAEYDALLLYSGGDGRKLYNALELTVGSLQASQENINITNTAVENIIQENVSKYDKSGDQHYDTISAFIKSIRGSDPNAAVYYLSKMLDAGESIEFIGRRLIISAAEDVGLANPNALLMAKTAFEASRIVGMPEARIILSQATIYLSCSEKSNSAYLAINEGIDFVKNSAPLSVPLHLRNAPTALMKELGYGEKYKYAHDFPNNFVKQVYLPDDISGRIFYKPGTNLSESKMNEQLKAKWSGIYDY